MPERRKYNAADEGVNEPLRALQGAERISPPRKGGDPYVPLPEFEGQQPNMIMKLAGLMGLNDDGAGAGLGKLAGHGAMVGGLPEGINLEAIKELLRSMGIPMSEEAAPLAQKGQEIMRKTPSAIDDAQGAFKDDQVSKYLRKFGGVK